MCLNKCVQQAEGKIARTIVWNLILQDKIKKKTIFIKNTKWHVTAQYSLVQTTITSKHYNASEFIIQRDEEIKCFTSSWHEPNGLSLLFAFAILNLLWFNI